MATRAERLAGGAIALAAAIFTGAGLTIGQLGVPIAVAIAVIGIVIGSGVARGRFSSLNST